MSRLGTILATIAFAAFAPQAGAAPFSGFGVGVGASSHDLDIDARFDEDPDDVRSETASKAGPMVDIGFGGRPSPALHMQAGIRGYDVELEATLFENDCVKVERHVAAYAQVGFVMADRHVLYGLLEGGGADVTVAREGFDDQEFDSDTFAFGVGYKLAFNDHVELFVEGVDRSYDDIAAHYDTADGGEEKKDITLDGTNLTAGFTFRF